MSVVACLCLAITLWAQNTYFGPTEPIPGSPHLIRVQILIRDSDVPSGLQMKSVTFNGTSIPLKPRDVSGYRGQASFQLPPGKYSLKWVVERDKRAWPRTLNREEEVILDPRDLWIQISIEGDTATIS
jgi:hypothetical protein